MVLVRLWTECPLRSRRRRRKGFGLWRALEVGYKESRIGFAIKGSGLEYSNYHEIVKHQ